MRNIKYYLVKWLFPEALIEARKREFERCERIALVEALSRKLHKDVQGGDAAGEILWSIRQFHEVDARDVETAKRLLEGGKLLPFRGEYQ